MGRCHLKGVQSTEIGETGDDEESEGKQRFMVKPSPVKYPPEPRKNSASEKTDDQED